MSKREVARRVGVSPMTIVRLERGERALRDPVLLRRLAAVLEMDAERVLREASIEK